jgi:hypothetical protein
MEPKHEDIDILDVMDRVLSAALREVRNARSRRPVTTPVSAEPEPATRKSQTALCIHILQVGGRPLHISALLDALHTRGVHTTRESLVSAISKKLAPLGGFVRTGPNTFGLAGRDLQEA